MSDLRKKPCCICRQWFRPNPRVGARQRTCGKAECRVLHRQKPQAQWRRRNRGYAIAYRIDQPAAQAEPPEVLRVPAPLDQLPVGVRERRVRVSTSRFHGGSGLTPGTYRERRVRRWGIVNPQATMQLEFHQLERRWEHLRVRQPQRQRRLMASLAESGQQTPIVVVRSSGERERYVVIDGYKRIAALEQLGRDTIEATVWAMSAAEALLLERTLRCTPQESALEQGWLLVEMEQSFGYGLEELARRFDRSVSWASRRLALVELLPESIQQQVREGKLGAQLAMKYLVPVARISPEDCVRMASVLVQQHCNTREAGQLYTAWREGSRVVRERILAEPELFLKTQRQVPASRPAAAGVERDLEMAVAILRRSGRRLAVALPEMDGPRQEQAQRQIASARQELERMATRIGKEQQAPHVEPSPTNRDSGTECKASEPTRDCTRVATVAPERAQSATFQLYPGSGNPTGGESRTLSATDPRALDLLQRESGTSP